MTRPTRLDQDYHRLARLPSCVTPVNTLTSLDQVPRIPPQPHTTKWRMRNGWNRWLVSPVQYGRFFAGTGISTRCPSTTPVGLALGPDSPWEDELDPGTLSHPAGQILTVQFVTHACILTRTQSTAPSGTASRHARRSPTHNTCYAAASAVYLSPTILSARNHSTSELLRTLSRVAASKPTSWLSSRSHILFHLVHP